MELPNPRFAASEMFPGSSEVPKALAFIARREGHWDQAIAHYEQALVLDPRNVELLIMRKLCGALCAKGEINLVLTLLRIELPPAPRAQAGLPSS
jgi:hypothetical protein